MGVQGHSGLVQCRRSPSCARQTRGQARAGDVPGGLVAPALAVLNACLLQMRQAQPCPQQRALGAVQAQQAVGWLVIPHAATLREQPAPHPGGIQPAASRQGLLGFQGLQGCGPRTSGVA